MVEVSGGEKRTERPARSREARVESGGEGNAKGHDAVTRPHHWAITANFYLHDRDVAVRVGNALIPENDDVDDYFIRAGYMSYLCDKVDADLSGGHVFFNPEGPACIECGERWHESVDDSCSPIIVTLEPGPTAEQLTAWRDGVGPTSGAQGDAQTEPRTATEGSK